MVWITLLISGLKLLGPAESPGWQVDHLLFPGKLLADNQSGLISRMAINTALAFLFSSIAILRLGAGSKIFSHSIALVVFAFGLFSSLGYLYKAPEFYDLLAQLPMAVHTSLCFIMVSLAILFAYPETGITKEFTSGLSGGYIGSVLMLCAFAIPIALGTLRLYALKTNFFSAQLATTFLILTIITFFSALIFYSIVLLNRKDLAEKKVIEHLRQSEERFRSLVVSIKDYAIFMLDANGRVVTWNTGAQIIKGYQSEEIIGKHVSVFYKREDVENHIPDQILKTAQLTGKYEHEGWRVRKDGSFFWANVVITALYDKDGILIGFAKVTRDTTDHKRFTDMLAKFNEELSRQVRDKTTELERVTVQLRRLTSYLQNAREEERKYIAREMHDELGQMLTGLKMDMVWLKKKVEGNDNTIKERFERTLELLTETRNTMGRIVKNLHPALLEDLGLTVALKSQCAEFEDRLGIKITFTKNLSGIDDMNLPKDIAIGLYRVFQESLTNIAKHADAEEVTAILENQDNGLSLRIADNGRGFDMEEISSKNTLGLVSIRERALMMNGRCTITSAPGAGTEIVLEVPLK